VRLTNQDEMLGRLIGMDEEKLQFETWFGGTLNVPRKMVAMIAPGQTQSSVIYEGPTGPEGWTVSRIGGFRRPGEVGEAWSYNNGAFISTGSGSLGREFPFPPLANIEFDLQWRGYLQMGLSLFSDAVAGYGGNSYLMQFNPGSVYFQSLVRQDGLRPRR